MSELTLDVGLAYKIKQALSRNGITDVADLDWLAAGDNIAKIRQVRLGYAEVATIKHTIDCDAAPFTPDGWKVEEHQKGGLLDWPTEVMLHLDHGQKRGGMISGHALCSKLAGLPVLNASVLDYLLAHSHLVPKAWEGRSVFFWGTRYRDRGDRLCVRSLSWSGDGWLGGAVRLACYFERHETAVVLKH